MSREILVVDANALAMIATIRSLGRAGYRPHAVSPTRDALGFKSRYCFRHAVHPDYDSPDLIPWLRDYVATNSIRAMVCGEAFLHAIDGDFDEFKELVPDAPSRETRQLCLSKARVWSHLMGNEETRSALPESGVFRSPDESVAFAASHSADSILYLKTDAAFTRTPGATAKVFRVRGTHEMREIAARELEDFTALFWQRDVSGLQVGVSLWRHKGRIVAENMVLGLHLYPYYAGNMSLRKTWWHERLLNDARCKLNALNWSGVAMMEYIWDPETDAFWFIEMNPRYWGYLHVDLSCGKDFPKWQLDAHFGNATEGHGPPIVSRTLRYAPGEILHVASRGLSPAISILDKVKSIADFLVLSVHPKVKADLWFAGDRLLYLYGWLRFARELPRRISRVWRRNE